MYYVPHKLEMEASIAAGKDLRYCDNALAKQYVESKPVLDKANNANCIREVEDR